MRALRSGAATIGNNDSKQIVASLQQAWNDWELQLMVVLSFTIQVFLLLTGDLRRRSINGLLRMSIWLAYVAADFVAVYALGLFSQYEEKYKLGRHSFGDTSTFLWVPFLLVHLGGQDSITAFSLEDNNLWLRHLLNLGVQVTLAMAVFWKSFHRISSHVLIPASFVFVSGVIKYGERIWALRSGSRDGLGRSSTQQPPIQTNLDDDLCCSRVRASYALQIVHHTQGLFVGRTILQVGNGAPEKFKKYFQTQGQVEEKLKILLMELGMMFDLLYTKAMVLQRRTGRMFRCVAQISMVVAFVLFQQAERPQADNHNRANTAISYTLFVGAIVMETCSVASVIASPWTRAHLKQGAFLQLLSSGSEAFSHIKSILQCNNSMQGLPSIVQGDIFDGNIEPTYRSTYTSLFTESPFFCKVINALGLGQQLSNLRSKKPVESLEAQDIAIARYLVEWFDRSPEERFRPLRLGRRLNYNLCLPFEHALYRLHIYTDYHICRHLEGPNRSSHADAEDVKRLKEQCEKLSDYMTYLRWENSMLPCSATVPSRRYCVPLGNTPRLTNLENHAKDLLNPSEPDSDCPFELAGETEEDLKQSLEEIKEMWTRLLIYAAGKCSGDLHALQLSKGGEFLTFIWLLMLHHGLGDAATEVKLLTSDDPNVAEPGSVVILREGCYGPRPEQPHYAFEFRRQQSLQLAGQIQLQDTWTQLFLENFIPINATGLIGDINGQLLYVEQDSTRTSEEEQDDEATRMSDEEVKAGEGTPREIDEEIVVASEAERQQHQAAPED